MKRGERIFRNLLGHMEKGGVCVLQLKYADRFNKTVSFIRDHVPLVNNVINMIRGRKFFQPTMQMNAYDLNKIFLMMQKINVRDFYAEYTDHVGHFGLRIYFKWPKEV